MSVVSISAPDCPTQIRGIQCALSRAVKIDSIWRYKRNRRPDLRFVHQLMFHIYELNYWLRQPMVVDRMQHTRTLSIATSPSGVLGLNGMLVPRAPNIAVDYNQHSND